MKVKLTNFFIVILQLYEHPNTPLMNQNKYSSFVTTKRHYKSNQVMDTIALNQVMEIQDSRPQPVCNFTQFLKLQSSYICTLKAATGFVKRYRHTKPLTTKI